MELIEIHRQGDKDFLLRTPLAIKLYQGSTSRRLPGQLPQGLQRNFYFFCKTLAPAGRSKILGGTVPFASTFAANIWKDL